MITRFKIYERASLTSFQLIKNKLSKFQSIYITDEYVEINFADLFRENNRCYYEKFLALLTDLFLGYIISFYDEHNEVVQITLKYPLFYRAFNDRTNSWENINKGNGHLYAFDENRQSIQVNKHRPFKIHITETEFQNDAKKYNL